MTKYFGISIDTPPGDGWVRLPVDKPRRRGLAGAFRGRDSELSAWADATARQLTGADGTGCDPDVLGRYAELLTDLTVSARERDVLRSYAWVPSSMNGAPIATIDISTIRWPMKGPELTLDDLETIYAKRDDGTTELDITRTEVPAGPAIRRRLVQGSLAQRHLAQEGPAQGSLAGGNREPGNGGDASETVVSITYAIRPPAIRNAVVYVMSWVLMDDFPALSEIADSLVQTLVVATG